MSNEAIYALNAECDAMQDEIERLESENASLKGAAQGLGELCDKYKNENAKLRWLANDMRACFLIGAERDGVSKQWCHELFYSYTDKLRELGIEVSDG